MDSETLGKLTAKALSSALGSGVLAVGYWHLYPEVSLPGLWLVLLWLHWFAKKG